MMRSCLCFSLKRRRSLGEHRCYKKKKKSWILILNFIYNMNTSRSFPRSWLITGFVTRLTRRVSLVEQELPTLPEHLSLPPVFSGVRVTWSLVLYVCFVDRCLSFCTFSFGHCVVCSSLIYGFWLPLWYLQALHIYSLWCRSCQMYNTSSIRELLILTINACDPFCSHLDPR